MNGYLSRKRVIGADSGITLVISVYFGNRKLSAVCNAGMSSISVWLLSISVWLSSISVWLLSGSTFSESSIDKWKISSNLSVTLARVFGEICVAVPIAILKVIHEYFKWWDTYSCFSLTNILSGKK